MTITVIQNNTQKKREYHAPVLLSHALNDMGFVLSHPCGGRGTCGKCVVSVTGELTPPTAEEQTVLFPCSLPNPRLACRCRAVGDAVITLCNSDAEGFSVPDNPQAPHSGTYFAAVDIGTTTVAAALVDAESGKIIKSTCQHNRQAPFGADVLSRLTYAKTTGALPLQKAIREQITELLADFGLPVSKTVITGNTAMLYFYKGLDITPLTAFPFSCSELFGHQTKEEIIPPCVSAFVGADTVCAMLRAGFLQKGQSALLADLGTNGELAFFDGEKITCCSAAVGPALEGAGIRQGTVAVKGAVCAMGEKNGSFFFDTIGNASPVGITGSGIIDGIAYLLQKGILPADGYLEKPWQIGESDIFIFPEDIRAVQLAKSALRTGIDMLCPAPEAVDVLYLAGGFGSTVNPLSCGQIGLIPPALVSKTVVLGNAALQGAIELLRDRESRETARSLVNRTTYIDLASQVAFSEGFIQNINF